MATMAPAIIRYWFCVAGLQFSLLAPTSAQYYTNVTEAIPQLEDLYNFPLTRSPYTGGQNFTMCCLRAVNESYYAHNGDVSQTTLGFINLTVSQLEDDQFPCGAAYNGSDTGAPLVKISYSWCVTNCPGWGQSTSKVLTQWVQPLVGFILPAAVFCLNVPRKMGLNISDKLFPGRFNDIREGLKRISESFGQIKTQRVGDGSLFKKILTSFYIVMRFGGLVVLILLEMLLRGTWAASIAASDTIIWVGVVFSTSAPMILSGLYEAKLDRTVIERIERKELKVGEGRNPRLYLEFHLLYAVLVGNLNLNHPEVGLDGPTSEGRFVWSDIKSLVAPFASHPETPKNEEVSREHIRNGTKVRLNGMLACQASFGAAIGAPVVFFLGSFFFSVFSNLSTVGDNDTSHALAFGMWWMTIPHVALVSGCLLAGNNPNTLEVIICGITPWDVEAAQRDRRWWHHLSLYRPCFDSVYQPVWMWERGRSKRNWIRRVQREFEDGSAPAPRDGDADEVALGGSPAGDRWSPRVDQFALDMKDWAFLITAASALMSTPFVLAYLTSYYTPTIGLSCRTFTFLLYILFQLWISAIWLWDFRREARSPLTTRRPASTTVVWGGGGGGGSKEGRRSAIALPTAYCVLMAFGLAGSALTTIAGTLLQILGVYRNCLCMIPIGAWASGEYEFVMSTNSADDIYYANTFWLPTGITSIVVLIIVCYVGWWYQRHWRLRFTALIDGLSVGEQPSWPAGVGGDGAGGGGVGAKRESGGDFKHVEERVGNDSRGGGGGSGVGDYDPDRIASSR